ncbi:hypothetical protein JCM24511_08527 [Saitozyma sp. JCM 24511]|nr:hypothetical protein JCM24511_08527 [Saitozyma sp. JCM 24511]
MSIRPRDIEVFLAGYPGQGSDAHRSANLEFYTNEREMQPDGVTLDEFVRRYERDYEELESNHGYIQWLFPIRERGVNPLSQPLQPHEIEKMSADPDILARLLRSYTMMLRFYGIDFNDGRLRPTSDSKQRLLNLHRRPHNLLRLTRILKHLSEFPALQAHAGPLVLFFVALHSGGDLDLSEGTMHGDSLDRWWSNCFRDEGEGREVRAIVRGRGRRGEGRWGMDQCGRWCEGRRMGWVG